MKVSSGSIALVLAVACASPMSAAIAAAPKISFGAAPEGNAPEVASRIIKENFAACKKVTSAKRLSDGSILAKCNGSDFRVFTAFKRDEGRTVEIAMNCTFLKKRLDIDC
ncbi:hypothetical protein [Massilia sp. Mn16-1_5]|uniref:hypothetical protein n=1 Tax=Massilia sp. Mn16-1_5 TaxID=2079199 RepID=UPI00109ED5C0|nr:hypothetical protein [Massilia sp. Mn16-1_5]